MAATDWTWDSRKAAANLRKHGVLFETACHAVGDEFALSVKDDDPDGDRWRTLGMIGGVLLFVVHTYSADGDGGRIISARRATPAERRSYEQA